MYWWNTTTSPNEWDQMGQDIDGENSDDWSGSSVSLSGDGTTLAIGAHGNDGNGESVAMTMMTTTMLMVMMVITVVEEFCVVFGLMGRALRVIDSQWCWEWRGIEIGCFMRTRKAFICFCHAR